MASVQGVQLSMSMSMSMQAVAGGTHHGRGGRGMVKAAADALGMSPSDLIQALKGDQSLADVAQAHGKSVSDLESAMTQKLHDRLDKAVADGKLSADQESSILQRASQRIDDFVEGKQGPQAEASAQAEQVQFSLSVSFTSASFQSTSQAHAAQAYAQAQGGAA